MSNVKIGNPSPLGLLSFALTTFVLSLHNGAMGVHFGAPSNVVIGLAMFYGGICQLLAGMWEYVVGNTFAATAFSSYGGFWLGYAAIFIPWFGISDAMSEMTKEEHQHSVAIFLMSWTILTFFLFVGALRKNVGLSVVLGLLDITFIMLTAGEWTGVAGATKAGGYFGLFTSIAAWYTGFSILYADQPNIVQFPNPSLAPKIPKSAQYDEEAAVGAN
ncbi:hypothetical protein H4219_006025 [Mycoemilia scoparia]|uniref:Uncharacterized protein n=1 Tax=Mycoemilia scoparia TaxID=417184 RepID=A0A9W8DN02_9FUNG|nr:hypothetical protein H4219_006025 [Mycoemilia scoparia]